MMGRQLDPRPAALWYTARRYYVDSFFFRHVPPLPPGSRLLDLGGKKIAKRGQFDISRFNLRVEYANNDPHSAPDYLCDAARIPVPDAQYDAVICAELLEHVPCPVEVLREAFRVLRPGGVLLLTTPFHYPEHADPEDYARYTDTWLERHLTLVGFVEVEIERQGCLLTVSADMLKRFAAQNIWPKRRLTRRVFLAVVAFWQRVAFRLERAGWHASSRVVRDYTTGFGAVARKPWVRENG
jgi:SAM-dependent methyltransferase